MKLIKSLIILCILSIVLNGCSSFTEAGKVLRNEKKSNSDEYLVKKKEPLTQPPDFKTIPRPGSVENKAKDEKNTIEKILQTSQTKSSSSESISSSAEEFILDRIKR